LVNVGGRVDLAAIGRNGMRRMIIGHNENDIGPTVAILAQSQ
jgi:hypothetical protein